MQKRFMFWMIAIMLPFALYETLTGHNILLEFASKFCRACGDVPKDPRWGLDRVQGVFDHPILFGVFCGSMPALVYYVLGYKANPITRGLKSPMPWENSVRCPSFFPAPTSSRCTCPWMTGLTI